MGCKAVIETIGGKLYQWDTGRKVRITMRDKPVIEVHFAHDNNENALVVQPVPAGNGVCEASIPNILLQSAENVSIYAVTQIDDCMMTASKCVARVTAREKPESYVYTETETLNYTTLATRLDEVEQSVGAKKIESPDNENLVVLRDLESGSYVLYGRFKPYTGADATITFLSGLIVNVLKQTNDTHVQVFYPYNNCVQYLKITDTSYERTNVYLNDLAADAEAAAEAEAARAEAEAAREQAEAQRQAAEEARNAAETARAGAEEARAMAWAETKSAAEAATKSANAAAAKAETATTAADAAKGAAEEAAAKATTAAGAANAAADAVGEAAEKATTAAGTATAAAETATAAGAAASEAAETATAAAAEANAAAEAATAAAESVAEHLDGQYAALMDDTNTTALFKRWWAATEGEGTKYERLCRWFDRIMRCDATFTVRFFDEAVSGDPSGTALDDLAALGPAPVATDTDTPESDWSVEHRMTWYIRANGLQREDGGLDVLAIEGEDGFDLTGEIAPVVTISCALYRKTWDADGYWYKSWRNSPAEGYTILPEGVRPDGSIRPFVWHSTFPGVLTAGGRLTSGAGRKINNFVSAQNAITNARKMGAFEGLMTDCDSIYALDQFQMRHQNKENGGIMEGCCRFNYQYAVALAESGVNRVLLTTSQAANLHVGCAVAVGDPEEKTNLDRGQSYMRNIVADALETAIESVEIDGTTYAAVRLDAPEAFNTTATTRISTMPWHSGTTDAVPGHHDGSPGSNTNGHFPFRLAGVEFMAGAYDVGLDPLYITTIPEGGKVNYHVYSCPDSTKQAGSEANYTDTGLDFQFATTGWQYARKFHDDGTVLVPTAVGNASETTHYKSAFYPTSWAGRLCPWRRGHLHIYGPAGLAGEAGNIGPGRADWSGCPRLGGSGARRAAG